MAGTAAQGGGFGPGFATGALIGSAPYYYGSGYGYDDYAYGGDGYGRRLCRVPAYGGGGDDAYCAQRFKSYDPAAGPIWDTTALRHPARNNPRIEL